MTAKRFEELLALLFEGNQSECARALEYDARQVRRWVAGEAPIPFVVAALLETMAARSISANKVRGYAGLKEA